ncbi:MAG: UDP-3-O-(3-hydroxymyristoyl)glucosamine N-acyltransferase [Desulfobulbaceae bacterium]|nr:UDP-3-O-(3-hydroxymyristoyl)glucosamine N-acyltransferase [Desulfobulbaceae bacterium]HIJ79306.1 UDP-3-O-(3-hydroxymyristoyl)glucosamine N-acyltransferase [Deltaproteobacteria bacterium]
MKRLSDLALLVKGQLLGDGDTMITGVADLDAAGCGDITFVADEKRAGNLQGLQASAVIAPLGVEDIMLPAILVADPYLAVAKIHSFFLHKSFKATGIHDRAVIGADCLLSSEVCIGPMVVVGDRVRIGERVTMYPGVVVGDDAEIGDDVVLHANVNVGARCLIGNRVIVHGGTVIGGDGFGYAVDEKGHHLKRPQVGIVQIDDDVEIGANACVDRATFGKTWIKQGVKIDNLVQIAHNVVVGEHSIIVAQVGIAGSATTGHHVVLGGQAAVNGHIHLGDGVMVAAKSGVHNNVEPGTVLAGIPAIAHKKWLRASAVYGKLPDLVKELRGLKKAVAEVADFINFPKDK